MHLLHIYKQYNICTWEFLQKSTKKMFFILIGLKRFHTDFSYVFRDKILVKLFLSFKSCLFFICPSNAKKMIQPILPVSAIHLNHLFYCYSLNYSTKSITAPAFDPVVNTSLASEVENGNSRIVGNTFVVLVNSTSSPIIFPYTVALLPFIVI